MRLLSALRCARCRCRSSKAQQLGFLLVHVAILAVSGFGYFVGIAWVASLAFVLACLSLALQLVRGSLTGRFSLLWVLVASNVVVYTAAACLGARLHGAVGAACWRACRSSRGTLLDAAACARRRRRARRCGRRRSCAACGGATRSWW